MWIPKFILALSALPHFRRDHCHPERRVRSLFLSLSLCRKHRRTSCLQAFVFSLVLAPWARAVAGRAPLRGGAAGALLGFNGEMLEDLEFLRCDLQVGKLYYG